MPKLDGISVLERMRAEPPKKLPTVVVASAVGEEKFIAHAIVLGASYYMIKPYELDDLLERILLVLEPGTIVLLVRKKQCTIITARLPTW